MWSFFRFQDFYLICKIVIIEHLINEKHKKPHENKPSIFWLFSI